MRDAFSAAARAMLQERREETEACFPGLAHWAALQDH